MYIHMCKYIYIYVYIHTHMYVPGPEACAGLYIPCRIGKLVRTRTKIGKGGGPQRYDAGSPQHKGPFDFSV